MVALSHFSRAQKCSNQEKEKEVTCLKKDDQIKHDLHETPRKLSKDQKHLSMHLCKGVLSDDNKRNMIKGTTSNKVFKLSSLLLEII